MEHTEAATKLGIRAWYRDNVRAEGGATWIPKSSYVPIVVDDRYKALAEKIGVATHVIRGFVLGAMQVYELAEAIPDLVADPPTVPDLPRPQFGLRVHYVPRMQFHWVSAASCRGLTEQTLKWLILLRGIEELEVAFADFVPDTEPPATPAPAA